MEAVVLVGAGVAAGAGVGRRLGRLFLLAMPGRRRLGRVGGPARNPKKSLVTARRSRGEMEIFGFCLSLFEDWFLLLIRVGAGCGGGQVSVCASRLCVYDMCLL